MRLLHGRPLAEQLNARSHERSGALQGRGIHPALAAISVGPDPAANTYLHRLVRGGRSLGIAVRDVPLGRDATEAAVIAELAPVLIVNLVLITIASFNTFDLIIPLTGGDYDLSVASVVSLSAMLVAILNVNRGWPIGFGSSPF